MLLFENERIPSYAAQLRHTNPLFEAINESLPWTIPPPTLRHHAANRGRPGHVCPRVCKLWLPGYRRERHADVLLGMCRDHVRAGAVRAVRRTTTPTRYRSHGRRGGRRNKGGLSSCIILYYRFVFCRFQLDQSGTRSPRSGCKSPRYPRYRCRRVPPRCTSPHRCQPWYPQALADRDGRSSVASMKLTCMLGTAWRIPQDYCDSPKG